MFLYLLETNLGAIRDSVIYDMDSDFDIASEDLSIAILNFDVKYFNSKDIVTLKEHVLVSIIFKKNVQNMDIKFDMTTRQKSFFSCL